SSDSNNFTGTFNNNGTVNVNAGTLALKGGGTHTGRFATAGNGLLELGGITQNLSSTATLAGALNISAENVNFATGMATAKLTQLTIGDFTQLNINTTKLIVQTNPAVAGDKAAKIFYFNNSISNGSNGATWTGTGITSSAAANDANHYGVGLFDNAILQKT